MGCDIHLHCEYREDGIWYNCDNFEWNQETGEYEFASIYSDRWYDLFGILAGVRSERFETIDMPRGLPKDMALKTKEIAEKDFDWTHSHSYLTLRDLLRWKEKQKRKWKKLKKKQKVQYDENEGKYVLGNDGYPIFKYEYHILDSLIRKMKDKMNEHVWCFNADDYWIKGDNFRIVFWFDN